MPQPASYGQDLPILVRHLRALVYTLNLVRFSVIILIAGVALLASGQGQDLLIRVGEDAQYGRLLLGTTLWGASIWLWARVLLNIQLPDPPVDSTTMTPYRRWTPRVLGLLAFWLVAWDASGAGGEAASLVWPTLILGVVFFLLVTLRRSAARKLAHMRAGPLAQEHWLYVAEQSGRPEYPHIWTALRHGVGHFGLLMLLTGTALFIWGVVDPLSMGSAFDVVLLLFVWGTTFLPLGSLISYYANRSGVPLLSLLLLAALLFSLWNDNHAIRALTEQRPDQRPTIDRALRDWSESNCAADGCKPFVVVATAGGGIRAGFWTGTVLGSLHQAVPSFDQQLFAISGVSGGSVGATFYRAAAIDTPEQCRGERFRDCLLRALGEDYLAPLSAALLYPDLAQRFLPRPWLPDRAQALEQAWTEAFAAVFGHEGLERSLVGLTHDQGRAWPALFLNATWANSGGRLVASSLQLGQDPGDPDAFSPLPKDQLAVIGHDLRLATAAHNSARFPFVSPAGSWRDDAGEVAGRLQDGGLFENYGATTAMEILELAQRRLGEDFRPLVILISSDPTLPEDLHQIAPGPVKNFASELLTTLRTLFRTRVAHGDEAAVSLRRWAQTRQAPFAYFHMCPPEAVAGTEPPLGWALSGRAQRTIQGYLLDTDSDAEPFPAADCRAANQRALRLVREQLRPSDG
jgi:hypothetical protein